MTTERSASDICEVVNSSASYIDAAHVRFDPGRCPMSQPTYRLWHSPYTLNFAMIHHEFEHEEVRFREQTVGPR